MPMFDMRCSSCLHEEEDRVVRNDNLVFCDTCGAIMVKKVGRSSFELKGSGWEKDGYK